MRSASTTRWSSSCLQQAGSGGSRSFCRMLGSWCICRAQWRRCMSGMRSSTHKQVIPGMGGDECRMALQACVLAPHVAGFTAGRVLTEGREESTTACSLPAQSAPSQTGMRRRRAAPPAGPKGGSGAGGSSAQCRKHQARQVTHVPDPWLHARANGLLPVCRQRPCRRALSRRLPSYDCRQRHSPPLPW